MTEYKNPPFYYDHVNAITSMQSPNTLHVKNTYLFRYFANYLLQKAMAVYKWEVPDNWDLGFLLYTIYCNGVAVVFDTAKYGVIHQPCGLSGYNVYYRPTTALVRNPVFNRDYDLAINKDCVLLYLQPNYFPVMDIINYYADLMALTAETLSVNIANSKLSYAFFAENDTQAQALKKMFDNISKGDLAVWVDKKLKPEEDEIPWNAFYGDIGKNYLAENLLSNLRQIENQFSTEFGIPNANTEKRERMGIDEINANNVETLCRAELWLENLKDGVERARKMFPGLELSVDWRCDPHGESDNVSMGAVPMGQFNSGRA